MAWAGWHERTLTALAASCKGLIDLIGWVARVQGVGYTYTGGRGGRAIQTMVDVDLAPAILGLDSRRIERVVDTMTWHVHYVARGGVASFAMSAIDIALWDLKCKAAGEPLWPSVAAALLWAAHPLRVEVWSDGV